MGEYQAKWRPLSSHLINSFDGATIEGTVGRKCTVSWHWGFQEELLCRPCCLEQAERSGESGKWWLEGRALESAAKGMCKDWQETGALLAGRFAGFWMPKINDYFKEKWKKFLCGSIFGNLGKEKGKNSSNRLSVKRNLLKLYLIRAHLAPLSLTGNNIITLITLLGIFSREVEFHRRSIFRTRAYLGPLMRESDDFI